MIPPILFRTVPETVDAADELRWQRTCDQHLTWGHVTYRDPIDPDAFPLTSRWWYRCTTGAQLAGLVRLEALFHHGGIYLDADVEVVRPFDDLLDLDCFAAWEDEQTVPDAVLGASPNHPTVLACINLALDRLLSSSTDWRTGNGAWATGPGVTTTVLPTADGVTLFGPDAFYPVHYSEKHRLDGFIPGPDTYAIHLWHGSWLAD